MKLTKTRIALTVLAFAAFLPASTTFAQRNSLDRFGVSGGGRHSQGPRSPGGAGAPVRRPQPGMQAPPGGRGGPAISSPGGQRPLPQAGRGPQFGGRPPGAGNPGAGNRPSRPPSTPNFNPATGGPIRNPSRPPAISTPSTPRPTHRPEITRPNFPNNPGQGGERPSVHRPTNRPPLNQPPAVRPPARPLPGVPGSPSRPLPGDPGRPSQRPPIQPPSLRPPTDLPSRPGHGTGRPPSGKPRPPIAQRPPGERPSYRPSYPTPRPTPPGTGRPPGSSNRPPWAGPPGHHHPNPGRPGHHHPGHGPGWVGNRPPVTRPGVPGHGWPGHGWPGHGHPHRPPTIGGVRPPGWHSGHNHTAVVRNLNRHTTIHVNNWGMGVMVGYPSYGHYWHARHVNNWHRSWYNGCWNSGSVWYTPFVPGTLGWGINASYYGWGLQPTYVNPYYVVAQRPIYDYSRPIVIQTLPAADESAQNNQAQQAQGDPAMQQALETFDQAVEAFRARDYRKALNLVDQSLRGLPNDPLIHEVRATILFALGEYRPAAAVLNSLLATSPGMDWSSMSQLYADTDEYTKHLKALQSHIAGNPQDTAALFLLAYHYLVLQEIDAAVQALQIVVDREPNDVVARKMLESLAPPDEPLEEPESIPAPQSGVQDISQEPDLAEVSIAGQWACVDANDTKIQLTIDEESKFSWTATPTTGPPTKVEGQATTTFDTLVLESEEMGTMVAHVEPIDTDQFRFTLFGSKAEDPGVVFKRVK